MDRVFLDSNVLFSAAYAPGSGLAALWRRPKARAVRMYSSLSDASIEARSTRNCVGRIESVTAIAGRSRAVIVTFAPGLAPVEPDAVRTTTEARDRDEAVFGGRAIVVR